MSVMVLAVVLATGAVAGAQTAPAAKPGAAATAADTAKLDACLKRWEEEMRKVQTLSGTLGRIDKDKSFGTTTKFTGYAQYMRSGTGPTALNLAHMEMKQEGKTDIAEKIICTGTYLYMYAPPQKEIRAYEIPRAKPGQVADDNFMSFMFGMKAEEAKKRYVLSLAKEDKWYIYVTVMPRFAVDKAEFARAQLVLNKDNFLPRQLWFEHSNGNEITWDIPRLQSGASIDRRVFDAPKPPPGWKLVPVTRAAAAPPRVVRPNN
jgi:TIGR03009 family protein